MTKVKPETLEEKTARLRALRLERGDRGKMPEVKPKLRKRPKYAVLDLEDAMPFGKHEGKLMSEVIAEDSGWITWAMENIPTFEISDAAQTELDLELDARRGPRAWE